jgi:hypothetical protein
MKKVVLISLLATTGCGASLATDIGVVTGGLSAVQCGIAVDIKDSAETPSPSPLQIAVDIAEQCVMDVGDIVNAFGANSAVAKAAQSNPTLVHAAVARARAAKK